MLIYSYIMDDLEAILANYNKTEQGLIRRAFDFAKTAHEGQMRLSGEPYINHPVKVAKILTALKLDATTIAAALLHDVPENTSFTLADIKIGDV